MGGSGFVRATLIQAEGDRGMTQTAKDESGQRLQLTDLAYEIIEHSGEHYGQPVVYYRIAGLVPLLGYTMK